MKIFVRSAAAVSPQHSLADDGFGRPPVAYSGGRLACIEPDYSAFVDVKQIRRMSRIVKMGVAAAMTCLRKAGSPMPDGIITGTAYGCLEDTGVFLHRMIEFKEELLTPTAFIQSTHNTVGAQIALLLQCHAYNNTIVHRGFSFENALLDAWTLLHEENVRQLLVGGIDEITNDSHAILSRFGKYDGLLSSSLKLFDKQQAGTINGEGAAFFLLTNAPAPESLATLDAVATFYKPTNQQTIEKKIQQFLQAQKVSMEAVDLIILGTNGDAVNDQPFGALENQLFAGKQTLRFKHLSGEYPTAHSFAVWLAVTMLGGQRIPNWFGSEALPVSPVRKILLYNHYQSIHHSLILLSAC